MKNLNRQGAIRRAARRAEAAALYDETEASQQAREDAAARRKAEGGSVRPLGRPTKRDRRQIHRFKSAAPGRRLTQLSSKDLFS